MEENKVRRINLSKFFLILSIIILIAIGLFIYKYCNEKITEKELQLQIDTLNNLIEDLQLEINTLNDTIDGLKNQIDISSETVNSIDSIESVTNTIVSESSASDRTDDSSTGLELGKYTVNEVQLDAAGVSNEDCSVSLREQNQFVIYMGWGKWHSGNYEIKDDILICKSNLVEWESGGYGSRATDVVFTFKIINSNKLELSEIEINDTDTEKLIYDDGLKVGMTYSIK